MASCTPGTAHTTTNRPEINPTSAWIAVRMPLPFAVSLFKFIMFSCYLLNLNLLRIVNIIFQTLVNQLAASSPSVGSMGVVGGVMTGGTTGGSGVTGGVTGGSTGDGVTIGGVGFSAISAALIPLFTPLLNEYSVR